MVELRETGSHSGGRLVAFHFPVPLPFTVTPLSLKSDFKRGVAIRFTDNSFLLQRRPRKMLRLWFFFDRS